MPVHNPLTPISPIIIPATAHHIREEMINKNALKVLERLQTADFAAYLVGGSVRDLLVGLQPKDFDIATDAHPEQIQKIFRNCRLIGRRFRLAHIYFKEGVIEVATFRAQTETDHPVNERRTNEKGMIVRDNIYGSIEDDAWRRDFTINALYYDHAKGTVLDFTGGMVDLQKHLIRMIGEPLKRYQEDPVRLIRAIRHAAKLNFTIEPATREPIRRLAPSLSHVPSARLFEEIIKIYTGGSAQAGFQLLREYGLFNILFPIVEQCLEQPVFHRLIQNTFRQADLRVAEKKSLNPAFMLAALLWPPVKLAMEHRLAQGEKFFITMQSATAEVFRQQHKTLPIAKRLVAIIQEIWTYQYRISQLNRYHSRIQYLFQHPRFRAAFDFLALRAQAGEGFDETVLWWEKFQEAPSAVRNKMILQLRKKPIDAPLL